MPPREAIRVPEAPPPAPAPPPPPGLPPPTASRTVLFVGRGAVVPGLMAHIEEAGFTAVSSLRNRIVGDVQRHRPRMILVTGEETRDGGEALCRVLLSNRAGLGVPVLCIGAPAPVRVSTLGPILFEPDGGAIAELGARVLARLRDAPSVAVAEMAALTAVSPQSAAQTLDGLRLVVVDGDPEHGRSLAELLRGAGAMAASISAPRDVARVRAMDPQVLLVDPNSLQSGCTSLLEQVRLDLRLRWSPILLLPRDSLLDVATDQARLGTVAAYVANLRAREHRWLRTLTQGPRCTLDLSDIGPVHLLRMLHGLSGGWRLELIDRRVYLEIECMGGLLCGTAGERADDHVFLDPGQTLSAWSALSDGLVKVSRITRATLDNVGVPIDSALSLVAQAREPRACPTLELPRAGAEADPAPEANGARGARVRRPVLIGALVMLAVALAVAALLRTP